MSNNVTRPTYCVFSSCVVECGTSSGGKDYHWSVLCLQELTASKGEVFAETAQGYGVFATLSCNGQRLLAIVVAAEILPFVIGCSFCVKRRNGALNICWEGKKFRRICSCERSLVTSCGRGTQVHICVDARTGLGTIPSRPYRANIGTATTVSHRVGKQGMFEKFIMEICPRTHSTWRTREPPTSTLAITLAHLNHNRLTTSFHLTAACVPEFLTHRPATRISDVDAGLAALTAAPKVDACNNRSEIRHQRSARCGPLWDSTSPPSPFDSGLEPYFLNIFCIHFAYDLDRESAP